MSPKTSGAHALRHGLVVQWKIARRPPACCGHRECHFERFMQAAHDTLIQVHSGAGAPLPTWPQPPAANPAACRFRRPTAPRGPHGSPPRDGGFRCPTRLRTIGAVWFGAVMLRVADRRPRRSRLRERQRGHRAMAHRLAASTPVVRSLPRGGHRARREPVDPLHRRQRVGGRGQSDMHSRNGAIMNADNPTQPLGRTTSVTPRDRSPQRSSTMASAI